jgi:hypothetical protein
MVSNDREISHKFRFRRNLANKPLWLFVLSIGSQISAATVLAQVKEAPASKPVIEKLSSAPDNFPIGPYAGNVISTEYQRNTSAHGSSLTATTRTKDEPSVAFAWYQSQLKGGGWSVILPASANLNAVQMAGKLLMLKAYKGNTALMVCCSKLTGTYTTILVTASQKGDK